jgi:hypothetical protein
MIKRFFKWIFKDELIRMETDLRNTMRFWLETPTLPLQENIERIVKRTVEYNDAAKAKQVAKDFVKSEEFLDEIVQRILRKQVK